MNEIKEYTAEEREEYIQALGVDYSAEFVPFSQSRYKNNFHKSLNWVVTIKKNNQELTTDYMQGSGHVPPTKYKPNSRGMLENTEKRFRVDYACEFGHFGGIARHTFDHKDYYLDNCKSLPKPLLIDVLYSLCIDSDVLDYSTFEEWADCFGADEDSRKAEKMYRACLEIALKMRSMFGDSGLQKLREVYSDY